MTKDKTNIEEIKEDLRTLNIYISANRGKKLVKMISEYGIDVIADYIVEFHRGVETNESVDDVLTHLAYWMHRDGQIGRPVDTVKLERDKNGIALLIKREIDKKYTPKDQVLMELEKYFGHLLNDGSGKPMQKSLEQVADEVIDLFRVKKEQREHE